MATNDIGETVPTTADSSCRDFGWEAQQAAEAHLRAINDAEERQYETAGELDGDWPETAGPWCGGCDTCVVRETLFAAWPILLEAARAEVQALARDDR